MAWAFLLSLGSHLSWMLSVALGNGKKSAAHLANVESGHNRQTCFMAATEATYLPWTSVASVFHQRASLLSTSLSSTFSKNIFFLIFETVINVYNEIRSHSPSISTLSKSPSDKTPHNIIFLFDDPLSPISAAHMGMNMGPSIKRNDPPPPGTLYCQKLLSKGRSLESCIICARSLAALVLCR